MITGVKKAIGVFFAVTLVLFSCSVILKKEQENEDLRVRLDASAHVHATVSDRQMPEMGGRVGSVPPRASSFEYKPMTVTTSEHSGVRPLTATGTSDSATEVLIKKPITPEEAELLRRQVSTLHSFLTKLLEFGSIKTVLQLNCGAWSTTHALANYKIASAGAKLDLVAYTGADPNKETTAGNIAEFGRLQNVNFVVFDAVLQARLPYRYDLVVLTDGFSKASMSPASALALLKHVSASGSKVLLTRSLRRSIVSRLAFDLHGKTFNLGRPQQILPDGRDTQLELYALPLIWPPVFTTVSAASSKGRAQGSQVAFE